MLAELRSEINALHTVLGALVARLDAQEPTTATGDATPEAPADSADAAGDAAPEFRPPRGALSPVSRASFDPVGAPAAAPQPAPAASQAFAVTPQMEAAVIDQYRREIEAFRAAGRTEAANNMQAQLDSHLAVARSRGSGAH